MIADYQRKQTGLRLKKRAESPASDQGCHSGAGSVAFQSVVSWGCVWLQVRSRQPRHGLCRKWTPSPSSLLQQAFEIWPRCDDLGLAIDTPEPPQAETPHAMPVFRFRKEWFDPDFPLIHGFLVGVGLVVPLHTLLIVSKKRTV
jgi:hypothetical protein